MGTVLFIELRVKLSRRSPRPSRLFPGHILSPQYYCRKSATHRLLPSRLMVSPSFVQVIVGSGCPFGGPHSSNASSPWATRMLRGSVEKVSRNTVNTKTKQGEHSRIKGEKIGGSQHSYLTPRLHLPATSSVAFLLVALPKAFLATHQYTPASESLRSLLRCVADSKKSEPSGSSMRCAEGPCVLMGAPSFHHSTLPPSRPSTPHLSVTGSCRGTTTDWGCSVMRGARE